MTSRNYGIPLLPSQIAQRESARMFQSGAGNLGGTSIPRSTYDAKTRADSSDHYELGGFLLFGGVILSPVAIVLGLVLAYMVFV